MHVKTRILIVPGHVTATMLHAFVGVPVMEAVTGSKTTVLKAKDTIPKGTRLTADMFEIAEVGGYGLPDNIAKDPKQVEGGYASVDITKGDFMSSFKFSKEIPFKNDYLYKLPAGKLAVSIGVKTIQDALTGKLREGDVVSVFASYNKSEETNYNAFLPAELKYVKVLAVSNNTGIDIDDATNLEEGKNNLPATVTLLVNEKQAAALAGLDKKANLHLVLAARYDNDYVQSLLDKQEEYFKTQEGANNNG